jgi:hypothetical protein
MASGESCSVGMFDISRARLLTAHSNFKTAQRPRQCLSPYLQYECFHVCCRYDVVEEGYAVALYYSMYSSLLTVVVRPLLGEGSSPAYSDSSAIPPKVIHPRFLLLFFMRVPVKQNMGRLHLSLGP